jgi:hypothetical protein
LALRSTGAAIHGHQQQRVRHGTRFFEATGCNARAGEGRDGGPFLPRLGQQVGGVLNFPAVEAAFQGVANILRDGLDLAQSQRIVGVHRGRGERCMLEKRQAGQQAQHKAIPRF